MDLCKGKNVEASRPRNMKQKLDVGGDGRGSAHVWDRGHLLSYAIRGQNGVLDVGLKCHNFPSSVFWMP